MRRYVPILIVMFCIWQASLASALVSDFWTPAIPQISYGNNVFTGFVIESFECVTGQTKPCGSNIGSCSSGIRQCVSGHWSDCIGSMDPIDERPDGIDNNCNGEIDEVFECSIGQTKSCGSNIGMCKAGVRVCSNGYWGDCLGGVYPQTDLCDGIDNNCNGVVDELCGDTCNDGTPYLTCSDSNPLYCENTGKLEPGCEECGCPFEGDSCNPDGTCSRYSHIKTAGVFYGGDLDDETVKWSAEKFDIFINFWEDDVPLLKIYTSSPVLYYENYFAISYPLDEIRYPESKYRLMQRYAESNSLDIEDFFLHYAEDTVVEITSQCTDPDTCPVCIADGVCNQACSRSQEIIDWSNVWLSSPDPDCSDSGLTVIKGWNPANDLNGDGIRDIEPTNPKATALYRHEARIPYKWYGQYLMNIANPDYRDFNAQYVNMRLTTPIKGSNVYYDGVVLENPGAGFPTFESGLVLEYPGVSSRGTFFKTDYSILLGYTKSVIGEKLQLPNVATFWMPEYVSRSDGHVQEGAIQDSRTAGIYRLFFDISRQLTSENKIEVRFAGWPKSDSLERDQIYTLATHYLGMTDNTYYLYAGSYTDPYKQWFPAMEYDIGKPLGDYYLFATGKDPSDSSENKNYEIYAREFEKALVVVKFIPWWTSSLGDDSETVHGFPETYRILNADGIIGEDVTTISLRNAEGVILLK